MGAVTDLIPGPDGNIRVVKVKTTSREFIKLLEK